MHYSLALTMTMATLVVAPAAAQDGGASGELSTLIQKLMNLAEVPGLSIATIEDGKLRWVGSFVVKDMETLEKVDSHTVFPAASLSKVVFAYAVLKLADERELDLDAPLSTYVPAYVENDDRVNLITARHVLTHRTGFPNWRPRDRPLVIHFNPGERFSYSGEGFVYLQRAVEKIVGQPLDVFMTKTVFLPLERDSTPDGDVSVSSGCQLRELHWQASRPSVRIDFLGSRLGSGTDVSRTSLLARGRQWGCQGVRHRVGSIEARRRRMKLYHAILDNGIDKALKQYEAGPPLNEDEMNQLGLRLLRWTI